SAKSKKEQYQPKSVHGFKIDIRLVVEVDDVAVGDCARKNDDSKAIKDNKKLLRECKDTM
ncbi:hypothetical protein BDB01DRAFT_697876, partial [Pilobolus umbonatus]